ncbi:diguanylate cyclase [Idiomarina seosinensis]|uniref:ligand-binding sensor domain-containing diguanylate cyclase n=1 Tax=Idiomarina seosinensis TaxID=281739 RepID=UPI00384E8F49
MHYLRLAGWLCLYCLVLLPVINQLAHAKKPSLFNDFVRVADETAGQQSSVYYIYRDQRNFLWFASDTDGVLRYDGYDYRVFSEQLTGDQEHVSYAAVAITDDTTLWAATWGQGLVSLNSKKQQVRHFSTTMSGSESLRDNRVQTLFKAKSDRLWVGTLSGLNYLEKSTDNDNWRLASLPVNHPLYGLRIWGLAEHDDKMWAATSRGLYQFNDDFSDWQVYYLYPDQVGDNRLNEIRTVASFGDRLWLGSNEGVFYLDPKQQALRAVEFAAGENQSIPRINTLAVDASDVDSPIIYAGGTDGLYQVNRTTGQYIDQQGQWNLLAGVDIRAIEFDANGSIWIGARNQGIFYARRQSEHFSAQLTYSVYSAQYGEDSALWLGTSDGLFYQPDSQDDWQQLKLPAELKQQRVPLIFLDSNSNAWVVADDTLLKTSQRAPNALKKVNFVKQQLNTENSITAIGEGSNGSLLFGFWGLGLAEYDPQNGTAEWVFNGNAELRGDRIYDITAVAGVGDFFVTRYSGLYHRPIGSKQWRSVSGPELTLPGKDTMLCAESYSPNTLWLCSTEGAWKIDFSTQQTTRLSEQQGLNSDRVVGIQSDQQGDLWLLTSRGLARYQQERDELINFTVHDGLPAAEMLRGAAALSRNGQLVVGTVKGAALTRPADLKINVFAPTVNLTRVMINNRDTTDQYSFTQPQINLPSDHRSIEISYSVMDFHDTSLNRGRYRILGLDAQWSDWRNSRIVRFTTLPPGHYRLQIEGENSLGSRSEEPLEILIHIERPWWQSFWLWLLVVSLVLLLAYFLYKLRFRALEKVNERLDFEIRQRTRELSEANERLRSLSQTDYLTQLLNRRGFSEQFKMLQRQFSRNPRDVSIALLDVDHFKQFNDRYGHEVGDQVLRALSKEMQGHLRQQDILARWGGEEFVILFPETDLAGAKVAAEKLRRTIEKMTVDGEERDYRVTVTLGVCSARHLKDPIEKWMSCADTALYEGKKQGRNRVQTKEFK